MVFSELLNKWYQNICLPESKNLIILNVSRCIEKKFKIPTPVKDRT